MDDSEREELRRFLAEGPMGWRYIPEHSSWVDSDGQFTGYVSKEGLTYPVWQPDIRIEQAMMVADKVDLLRGDEGGCKLWKRSDDIWVVGDEDFHDFYGWSRWFDGQGDIPAEAICRAVKEAWSHDQKEDLSEL